MASSRVPYPVTVLTGASRGLGLGLACWLAAQHLPLVITARHEPRLKRLASRLRSDCTPVLTFACDASDEDAMTKVFVEASSLGPLGAVVNNAGLLEPIEPVSHMPIDEFSEHIRTNITGVLVGMKLALRYRLSGHPLRVVNLSSGAAVMPFRGWAAYCASKAAVNSLTQVTALEANDGHTSIVAIAPGVIETRMQRMIRATPEARFPDVQRFVHMKNSGSLLSPVQAALTLDWLLRGAPLSLSGKFLDARDPEVEAQVLAYQQGLGEQYHETLKVAQQWFTELETL